MKPWLILAGLALAGCTVGPNYKPPRLPLAAAYHAPAGPLSGTAPWWMSFHDPVLNALEARALSANLGIEQALARVDEANALFKAQRAAQGPQAALDGHAARQEESVNAGLGEFTRLGSLAQANPALAPLAGALQQAAPNLASRVNNDFQLGINTGWDLDFAGGLRRQAQAAGANADAAQAGVAAARLSVAAELADAYLRYRAAQIELGDYQKLDGIMREQLGIMAARVKLGAASKSALDSASARESELAAAI
ncbi:MAG: TolC family protein, partial [Alphaproteobacteria bacterium]|nr:TolC family protein [Alphaproteobacteria bacterium]